MVSDGRRVFPLFGLSEDSFEDRVGKRVGYSFAALKKERAVTAFNLGSSKAYLDPLLLYIRKRLPKCQIQESKSSLKAALIPFLQHLQSEPRK